MHTSPLIPVIDLRQGIAVRGVGGKRHTYRSVRESGLPSDQPLEVARWYRDQYRFDRCYVADLDALQGATPDLVTLERLLDDGFQVISDAAWSRSDAFPIPVRLTQHRAGLRPIAALESLDQPECLVSLCERLGPQAIFSLDLFQGSPLLAPSAPTNLTAIAWLELAAQAGFSTLLLLDLADVGVGQGTSTLTLLQQAQKNLPHIHWWGGGGIRGEPDVRRLLDAGFESLLVASALFSGDLRGFLPT